LPANTRAALLQVLAVERQLDVLLAGAEIVERGIEMVFV
jgi:hypothetical protein